MDAYNDRRGWLATKVRTLLKYLFVHLPEWTLGLVVASLFVSLGWLSWSTALALLSAWILVDLAIYPLVRGAYAGKGPTGVESLIGMTAQAQEPLHPRGFVSVRGELWTARLAETGTSVPAGAMVQVSASEGLTLIVTPTEPPSPR